MEDIYRFFNYQVELGPVACGFRELQLLDKADFRTDAQKLSSGLPFSGKDARSLILKRGLCPAKDLAGWWQRAENGRAEARDVSVILLDEKKKPAAAWYFFNARPVDLKAPVYEGREEEMPVEELVLSFDAVRTSVLGGRKEDV